MHAITNETREVLARWKAGDIDVGGDIAVEQSDHVWILGDGWICYEGTVTFRRAGDDFDVAISVGNGGNGPTVTEVAYRTRRNGPDLGGRRVRDAGVTSHVDAALRLLVHQVDDQGSYKLGSVATEVPAALQRAMAATRTRRRKPGRPELSDEELRLIAKAYRAARSRGRYAAILAEYRTGSLVDFDMPTNNNLGQRISRARKRVDPETGKPFLAPVAAPK